ncbi:MAG TPA: molybdate ABC transporter permease subunit [Caldilineae bacterium]|nr:molybdate ABC transporter permease subunit [Caldilineae bacterium]
MSVWQPMWLSLRVASLATLIALVTGVLLARLLARRRHPLLQIVDALTGLPMVMPPTVLGYYLLVALGQRSPLGRWLGAIGIPLVFTWRGAVIAAAIVVLPLVVQSTRAAMESVASEIEDVARTLGRSEVAIFFTVTLPLAWRGILAGIVLAFARALGEFGATLMVAGNIPGRTQTMPIAIYDAVQAGDQARANWLVLLLTAVALVLLVMIRTLGQRARV